MNEETESYLRETEMEFRASGFFDDADRTRQLNAAHVRDDRLLLRITLSLVMREALKNKGDQPLFYYDLMP